MRYKELWREIIPVLAVAVLGSMFAMSRMTSFYDPFDFSGFMDVYYRLRSGQKLYADFFYNAGPVHAYIGTFFFWLFGAGKNAIFANATALSLFMSTYAYTLARSGFGKLPSMGLALLCTLYFVGPIAFPNYDHHAWVFLLVAVALLRHDFSKGEVLSAALRGGLCGLALALSFLSKANIGAMGIIVTVAVLLLLPHAVRSILWLILGLFFSVNAIFFTLGTPYEFFHTNFVEYPAVSRLGMVGLLFNQLHDIPYTVVALAGTAVALAGGAGFLKKEKRDFTILLGLTGTSAVAVWTASMAVDLNGFILGIETVFLLLLVRRLPRGDSQSAERRIYHAGLIMISVFAVLMFITGLEKTERWSFFKPRLPQISDIDYEIKADAMKGWRCLRIYCEGMDDAVDYLNANVSKKESLFVFPDMQVIYMLTGHESFPDAPFQFLLNALPAPGKATTTFQNHFDEHAPKWIVLHEISFLPALGIDTRAQLKALLLDAYLWKHYSQVWSGKRFSILRHNR